MNEANLTPDQVRGLARVWWVIVLIGVLSLIAGIIIISEPEHSLKTLAVIAGIFILIDGIVELVIAFTRDTPNRTLAAVLGSLSLVIGILLVRHPLTGVQAVAILLGIWLIVAGVIRLVIAFETHGERLGRIVVAGIEILFGIVIISSTRIGYATLALLVGLSFIANGLGMIAFGIMMRSLRHGGDGPPNTAVAA